MKGQQKVVQKKYFKYIKKINLVFTKLVYLYTVFIVYLLSIQKYILKNTYIKTQIYKKKFWFSFY